MKKTKNQKSKLSKKLKSYTTIALSAIAADASSQIIYTDIRDTTLINNGDFFDIDLNNDGINDIEISLNKFSSFGSYSSYYYQFKTYSVEADGLNSANVNAVFNSNYTIYEAAALSRSSSINSSLNTWNNYAYVGGSFSSVYSGPSYSSSSSAVFGQFAGNGDKYLGVRFNIGTSVHYGWVRLDMATNFDITIKDFAFDTTANAPILAGDTGISVGLTEINEGQLEMYSQNNSLVFPNGLVETSEIRIYDLKGQLIERSRALPSQGQIQLRKQYQGIYIVEVNQGKSVFRKKLWLESH